MEAIIVNTEYEVRVLEINQEEIIKKLEQLGAKKVGDWFQKRYVFDTIPKKDSQWYRLRSNGNTTTLTYKNVEENTIDGTKELEIEVSDFDKTYKLLEIMGYKHKAYQENKRIRYILDNVEIDIDTWPLIPTYMEIEGKSKEAVYKILKKLNIIQSQITTLNCQDIYQQIYNINIDEILELKF